MIDLGLAILVGFSPILLLLVLLAALEGTFECRGLRGRRLPPLTPFVFVTGKSVVSGSDNVGPPLPVLASDRERDGALRSISCAVGEGRLSLEEAEQRIGAVLRSRHRHELGELLADLPGRTTGGDSHEGDVARDAVRGRGGLFALAVVALFVAATVQVAAGLWELWPIAVATFALWGRNPRPAPRGHRR